MGADMKEIAKRCRNGETVKFDNDEDCVKNQHDDIRSAEVEFSKSICGDFRFKVWFDGKIVLMSKTFPKAGLKKIIEKWNLKEVQE